MSGRSRWSMYAPSFNSIEQFPSQTWVQLEGQNEAATRSEFLNAPPVRTSKRPGAAYVACVSVNDLDMRMLPRKLVPFFSIPWRNISFGDRDSRLLILKQQLYSAPPHAWLMRLVGPMIDFMSIQSWNLSMCPHCWHAH